MLNEEIIKYRLESLKMSYEISLKIGNIKDSYDKDHNQIKDDLQDIFTLADMNFQYIINGIHPCYEEEESDN